MYIKIHANDAMRLRKIILFMYIISLIDNTKNNYFWFSIINDNVELHLHTQTKSSQWMLCTNMKSSLKKVMSLSNDKHRTRQRMPLRYTNNSGTTEHIFFWLGATDRRNLVDVREVNVLIFSCHVQHSSFVP